MTGASRTVEPQQLLLGLLDPANRRDPYPVYNAIRAHGPLSLPDANLAVFSSFTHCDQILRHPSSANDRLKSTMAQKAIAQGEQARPFGTPGFLFLDAPDHTRLRKLAQKAFAPKVVRDMESEITALVGELVGAMDPDRIDVIAELAYPLPVAVICRLLGVSMADEPEFSRASALLAQSLDPFLTLTGELPENFEQRMEAGLWLRSYLRELVQKRRAEPRNDLISALIAAEEGGDQLTEEEIVATCNLLLIAGHETTVNLIANSALAMLRHPQHWAALSADPGRAGVIIEETLRYDPPVQLTSRVAGEDMTIGDVQVPKGDVMLVLIAAAQRDPDVYADPDDFDPDRESFRHLAFGLGPHFCLGAPLARLEAVIALSALAARFPAARLVEDPGYKPNVTLRGMSALMIAG